ncbi:hypothetical protein KY363_00610 [Candidatus Woesearchaeota archaeon]|nr:hypothetical protein [Candidatus Woesearchaeota archaeon]
MALKIRCNINGKAKGNQRKEAYKEKRRIEKALHACPDVAVEVTTSEDQVKSRCKDWREQQADLIILSGGDGTVKHWLTTNFRENYRRLGNGMMPNEFAHQMNRMSFDPKSGLFLPPIHHKPKGTVNFWADTLCMGGDLDVIAELLTKASRYDDGLFQFKRVYIPVFMLYNKDRPYDLDEIHLGTTYADGFLYNVFWEYYAPKRRGGDSSIASALQVIARSAASIGLDSVLPRDTPLGKMYSERYMDRILTSIRGEVVINDNTTVVGPDEERNVTAIGCMNVNLYGIKPFYKVPSAPEKFVFYSEGQEEKPDELDINDHMFHVMVGKVNPLMVVGQLPNLYLGKETTVEGLTDRLARKLEIRQHRDLKYIIEGSEQSNGKTAVIELAYLQPVALIGYDGNGRKANQTIDRVVRKGLTKAQEKLDDILGRE